MTKSFSSITFGSKVIGKMYNYRLRVPQRWFFTELRQFSGSLWFKMVTSEVWEWLRNHGVNRGQISGNFVTQLRPNGLYPYWHLTLKILVWEDAKLAVLLRFRTKEKIRNPYLVKNYHFLKILIRKILKMPSFRYFGIPLEIFITLSRKLTFQTTKKAQKILEQLNF